jgi:mono/diheme cytochrome c family protein
LFRQGLPPVEIRGDGSSLGLAGRSQGVISGVGYLDLKLASVSWVSCPRDQTSLFQPSEDAPEGLALYVNLCGELFLVHGAGCHGFQGDDGGTRQPQRCQGVVVETLD